MSSDARREYEKHGFWVADWRLPTEMVEKMRRSLAALVDANPSVRSERLLGAHIVKGQAEGLVGNADFFDYATHPQILDQVEQFIGPDIVLFGSQVICKPARESLEVPWHQDGYYWPVIRPLAVCSVWIAIDDSTEEAGCVRAIPGSHRPRVLIKHREEDRDQFAFNKFLEETEFDASSARSIELRAGQVSFHDGHLIHGSAANHSEHRRAAFIVRYMPATSHWDRNAPVENMYIGTDRSSSMNLAGRPLWLVRGTDRSGRNDFKTGH
jgi:hypothetical protein